MVILGIDPGLSATGYGFIEAQGARLRVIEAGDIRPPRTQPLARRLERIHQGLTELIGRHRPEVVVLEKIFTHHQHVTTAAMMGHARGVACLVAQEHRLPLEEHLPTHVKKSLTGNGSASKEQVARMVERWLGHADPSWSSDATDALALAIVHAHARHHQRNLAGVLP
ncbi:MAG: crossover junction endodeoxyribonuclease RuvC [Candidatus Omnitrophica bacterium]|nr:crossover junction endodeoxyribonuclease RuvC [Candidatus Omnitrophota bacterium]